MRVIAGKYRGRRLKGPDGLDVRPTGDRLKESLFNILAPDIRDAVVLDAFSGTGSVGIEALSRGARQAVFIEASAAGCRLLRKNLELCGVSGGVRVIQDDVFGALRALGRKGFQADIVFFDPPYDFEPYKDLLDIVFSRPLLAPSARVIVEHRRIQGARGARKRTPDGVRRCVAELPESGAGYLRTRLVRQGDQCLSFYGRADAASGAQDAAPPSEP
ncbi:MAG: 16S rRNA (guanine(966)-N(2))-methyltransferase RsmD [Acidobacteriota bacterium]|jgi:16S rRNA (guanine(966)-N(2))-methyltransferase RsmD|nr:16S rRNA (guanine(966)-N(2))-methyltransferase RsmD [Acidobacteriota bacterium]